MTNMHLRIGLSAAIGVQNIGTNTIIKTSGRYTPVRQLTLAINSISLYFYTNIAPFATGNKQMKCCLRMSVISYCFEYRLVSRCIN